MAGAQQLERITGILLSEYSMSGKLLELLKEIAPRDDRAAVLRDHVTSAGIGKFAAIQAAAPSLGLRLFGGLQKPPLTRMDEPPARIATGSPWLRERIFEQACPRQPLAKEGDQ
jgi:hypothetical protein